MIKTHPFLVRMLSSAFLFATLLALLTGASNAQAASHDIWQTVPSANGSQAFNQLYGLAAITSNNVWAVGKSSGSSYQSLIEHWNGKIWQTVPTPDSGLYPVLKAVAAIPGTNQVWAVGTQWTPAHGVQTLAERWNGKTWQIIPTPLIQGNIGDLTNILYSVVAISNTNAWATGVYNKGSGQSQAKLIEHWNGKQWSIASDATIPGVLNSWLFGISACSENNIWAVGQSVVAGKENALVEHWNGHNWQIIPAKNPGAVANALYGITCIPGTNQLWAVGTYLQSSAATYQTLTERWNGSSWHTFPSPNLGTFGSNLASITALSTHNAWAAGTGKDQGLIEHWNGSNWSIVSQAVPSTINELNAITHVPGTDRLWAVGDYYASNYNAQSTLIERYS